MLLLRAMPLHAQELLNKRITVDLSKQPLSKILANIGKEGGFYFSYNSDMLPGDSIVSLSIQEKPVREILQLLLGAGYEYKETGTYIIIRPKMNSADPYVVSGYVIDKSTGDRIPDASVYEGRQLISTLTDAQGYFRLRLHTRLPDTYLSVSKLNFNDTSYSLDAGRDQTLTLAVSPIRSIVLKPVTITPYSQVENTWFGKFFISSKQKVQDINLSRFFANKPFQYSIVPGIGTHGKLGAQVINKFSMNILGGYTAGVNGFEFGGLFNIDKKAVQYVQLAGLFNTVGGGVKGFQLAGLHNGVLDSVNGVQIAGLNNKVSGALTGMEIAGLYNHVAGDASGMMVAGIYNVSSQEMEGMQIGGMLNRAGSMKGVQLAGIGNVSKTTMDGLQLAGVFNAAKYLSGTQIGLVNIADTSSGYSIGVLNFIKHGYHKFSVSFNESMDFNMAYKSGNQKLYSLLLASTNLRQHEKAYSLGYGLGKSFMLNHRFSLTTEFLVQGVYIGQWNDLPFVTRFQPSLQVGLSRKISLFVGPSVSACFAEPADLVKGYASAIAPPHHITFADNITGWIGGQIGITFF